MSFNKKSNHYRLPKQELKLMLKLIGTLSRSGMVAGNNGDFDSAFHNCRQALLLAKELKKECLVAKLLNNLGILYHQSGAWDKALLSYEKSMSIVIKNYGQQNFLYKTIQKNITCLFSQHQN
ncbi:MAG: tetratricopeptide repeat protein [Desulfobacula sp.]|jgi:tetratricopeptide (TPR) repeat protein|uniref:tetratricopeptide repeat protein n=1 Tax=Desulfobacula sp. TaxID=2593537 RepID=UPI001D76840A|nr:tetratricopeptide repeat protein [Desulfobacula sp.]MBT4024282.1 tetratricopeptide repeat protein [Desulfobacula sp.]MBT4874376.1 tetratricopeptide repeat protein [Desulfobacula sp.]MBT5543429.1 tetratricopeptide repeat protein [Desulfobacula sp.]MBT7710539.1 tetratricopeptide repeat protein [Deltaproteobacteria bacterium]